MAITNKMLFDQINTMLKANLCPNIVDEVKPADTEISLKGCSWNVVGELCKNFGEIFLDLYAVEGNAEPVLLGTYRSYRKDHQAFRAMAILQGEFIWETSEFVKSNLVQFMPDC